MGWGKTYKLCKDSLVKIVVKGKGGYKTSHEIKEKAKKKIKKAKRKYRHRCDEFNEYIEELEQKISTLYKKKEELAMRMGQKIKSMPNIDKISSKPHSPKYHYKPSKEGILLDSVGMGKVLDIKGCRKSAKKYLEDAKDFKVEVSGRIAEINRVQAFLDTVKNDLDEEEILLAALEDSMNKKRDLPYNKVEKQLHILLTEYILDVNGKRNEKYNEAVKQLRKIC